MRNILASRRKDVVERSQNWMRNIHAEQKVFPENLILLQKPSDVICQETGGEQTVAAHLGDLNNAVRSVANLRIYKEGWYPPWNKTISTRASSLARNFWIKDDKGVKFKTCTSTIISPGQLDSPSMHPTRLSTDDQNFYFRAVETMAVRFSAQITELSYLYYARCFNVFFLIHGRGIAVGCKM